MHEFSLAINIVEIAEEQTRSAGAKKIFSIDIEVGEMSGVIYEALETAMESAKRSTLLEGAEINLIPMPGIAKCKDCGHEFETNDYFTSCPACNGLNNEIVQGKELKVRSLNVE